MATVCAWAADAPTATVATMRAVFRNVDIIGSLIVTDFTCELATQAPSFHSLRPIRRPTRSWNFDPRSSNLSRSDIHAPARSAERRPLRSGPPYHDRKKIWDFFFGQFSALPRSAPRESCWRRVKWRQTSERPFPRSACLGYMPVRPEMEKSASPSGSIRGLPRDPSIRGAAADPRERCLAGGRAVRQGDQQEMQQEIQNGTRPTSPARTRAGDSSPWSACSGWLGACDGDRVEDAASDAQGDRVSTSDRRTSAEILLFAPPLAPDATLAEALRHPEPFERVQRVAEILETARPDQLGKILAAFESAPLPWGDAEYALFASWWARFDPEEAIFYCFDDEFRLNHPHPIREVLRVWGRQDPAAVIASNWLIGNTQVPGLNPAFVEPFVIGWFESGQPGLLEWIQSIDPASKAAAIGTYFRMVLLRDGARAPSNGLERRRSRTTPAASSSGRA